LFNLLITRCQTKIVSCISLLLRKIQKHGKCSNNVNLQGHII
jgi:hypothetical protein